MRVGPIAVPVFSGKTCPHCQSQEMAVWDSHPGSQTRAQLGRVAPPFFQVGWGRQGVNLCWVPRIFLSVRWSWQAPREWPSLQPGIWSHQICRPGFPPVRWLGVQGVGSVRLACGWPMVTVVAALLLS